MHKRKHVFQELFVDETSKTYFLNYYLTLQKSMQTGCRLLYGIEVEKCLIVKDESFVQETEFTGAISENEMYVYKIIDRLARNSVTPVSLNCIVDDILQQNEEMLYSNFNINQTVV